MISLKLTAIPGIPIIAPGDDIAALIIEAIDNAGLFLGNNDVLVVAEKVVSKAERRFVNLTQVEPSILASELSSQTGKDPRLIELILQESRRVVRVRQDLIIVEHKNGFVCANAGIDHSNVQIGVLIIDSHGRAWRMGTTGSAIGISGVPGLVDLRGRADLFGYKLRATYVAAADELAAAASLVMGQADESSPVVLVQGFPYELREGSIQELIRPADLDLFR